ncbi:MAG: MXAN_5187 C-terminal domain-containing protein [bacterium]
MFLTKIWSVLVTLFAIAVTAAFLLATPPAETELQDAYYKQLDGAQGLVDSHLRMESRRRLDFFSLVGKDYKVVKLLKQLRGKDKTAASATAQLLQTYAYQKLKSGRAEKAFAKNYTSVEFTDADGMVWARLGENEGQHGDSLRSFPGVKLALDQGVCADNTLDVGGALYFVWGCPIRYVKQGEKIELVGALLAKKRIDDDFARGLLALIGVTEGAEAEGSEEGKAAKGKAAKGKKEPKAKQPKKSKKLKINIAFFRQQKLVAKTGKSKLWAQVSGVYKKHQASVNNPSIGRSPAVELKEGGRRYLMVIGRLPGEASGGGNVWAILWQFPTVLGPSAFMDSKLPRDQLFKYLPMALFVVLGVLALFLTVFLMWFEGDRPIGKLLKQAQQLSLGNSDKLDDTLFRGRLGSIARSINEGLERVGDAAPSKPALHDKDLDSILGGPDVATEDFEPPPKASVATSKPTGSVLDGFGGGGELPPPAASTSGGAPPPPPDLFPADAEPPRLEPTPSGNFSFGVPSGQIPTTTPGHGPGGPPPPPPPLPAGAGSADDAVFREVFEQFVATKKQCGEPVDKLTFDAFRTKLDKNRQAVIDQTGCRDVNFRVYIKDGKAALKATPVKE